jgi:methylamine dehydrogenase accessory protein MauD
MSSFLIVSNILLWIAVIGLLLVVFALLRQVGVLYERIAPAGALMINKSLNVGDDAPAMELRDLNSGSNIAIAGARDKAQLLFFVSPDCPVCKTLLPVLQSSAQAENKWLDVVLASDGEDKELKAMIAGHKLQAFPFVNSELLGMNYGVSKLPYAVLLDESGKVQSLGLINSREHLESLFEARERNVASLQEYMQGGDSNDKNNGVKEFDPAGVA